MTSLEWVATCLAEDGSLPWLTGHGVDDVPVGRRTAGRTPTGETVAAGIRYVKVAWGWEDETTLRVVLAEVRPPDGWDGTWPADFVVGRVLSDERFVGASIGEVKLVLS